MTVQPQHCEHECVCMGYANRSEMFEDGICTKPICPHDTRPAPASPLPEEPRDILVSDEFIATIRNETLDKVLSVISLGPSEQKKIDSLRREVQQ